MRRVEVTSHALQQARLRRHFPHCREQEVRDRIRAEVADAIAAGRVANAKPPWVRLGSGSPLERSRERWVQCRPGSRCVWDADERLAWIIKTADGVDLVITSLHRVRAKAAAA